jgi:hypothetical protein
LLIASFFRYLWFLFFAKEDTMPWNIFSQAPIKSAAFPGGTIGGVYHWLLTSTNQADVTQDTADPFVNLLVDVPDGETRGYSLTVSRLDAGGAQLGGSLAANFVVPPPPPPVLIDVVDNEGVLLVEVTGAAAALKARK